MTDQTYAWVGWAFMWLGATVVGVFVVFMASVFTWACIRCALSNWFDSGRLVLSYRRVKAQQPVMVAWCLACVEGTAKCSDRARPEIAAYLSTAYPERKSEFRKWAEEVDYYG